MVLTNSYGSSSFYGSSYIVLMVPVFLVVLIVLRVLWFCYYGYSDSSSSKSFK